jgi:hypothetical protein
MQNNERATSLSSIPRFIIGMLIAIQCHGDNRLVSWRAVVLAGIAGTKKENGEE